MEIFFFFDCWKFHQKPDFNQNPVLWFVEQCHGYAKQYHSIASALDEMNEYQNGQPSNSDDGDDNGIHVSIQHMVPRRLFPSAFFKSPILRRCLLRTELPNMT